MADDKKISIKLLVDKVNNKVVFAESDKDFVEILFSFLALPFGSIVSLSNKESKLGCMDDMYRSVEVMDKQYLQTEACKELLLRPRSASETKFKSLSLNYDGSTNNQVRYYICPDWTCSTKTHCLVSMFENAICLCGQKMKKLVIRDSRIIEQDRLTGAFVTGTSKFEISDDLHVKADSPGTGVYVSHGCGSGIEQRTLCIGIDEVLNLLKRCLISKTPMTDVFLLNHQEINKKVVKSEPLDISKSSKVIKSEPADINRKKIKVEPLEKKPRLSESQSDTKKMSLTLLISKSHNKVLYAIAKEDFVDFILSFLAFPVASVVKLLGEDSFAGSIHNLFKSVNDLLKANSTKFEKCRDSLLQPKVFRHHGPEDPFLSVKEEVIHFSMIKCSTCFDAAFQGDICKHGINRAILELINPKFQETVTLKGVGFVKGCVLFKITDEMIVEPFSPLSGASFDNGMATNDLEERVVSVGIQEALSILKGSLTSKTALTNAFCSESKIKAK